MPLTLNTPIMGSRPSFDGQAILGRMERPDTKDWDFFQSLESWAYKAGIDPAIPAAQFLLETDNGKSVRWNRDLNASGMGIVSDGTAQPFHIPDVDASARLFIQCLYSLVTRGRHPDIPLWPEGEEWFARVWLPKVKSTAMPKVSVLGDLGLRYTERGDSRATWSWEDGQVPQDTYGKKLISRMNQFYPNLPDRSEVDTPSTPEEPVFATWRQQFDVMFGKNWRITQDWKNDPAGPAYDDLYAYGAGHGLNGQEHPGIDVAPAGGYGANLYAPSQGTVVCAGTNVGSGAHNGGCGAYNDYGDGWAGDPKVGVGRIEIYFPDLNASLIYGHCRTCTVRPGQSVKRGDLIGTSGGMGGHHVHLEAIKWGSAYIYIDPKDLLETLPITPGTPVEPGEVVALLIRQMMIPAGNRNRPGSKLNDADLYITIHDTGNPGVGADAEMHAQFVRNGGGSESVSFHGTMDDHEFIQLLPFDEIGWHAGDGCDSRTNDIGCFQSIGLETCVNVDGNWNQTKENLIDSCVAIIKGDSRLNYAGRKGKFSPTRIRQHNASSGKNCPARIRAEGSWGYITGQITSRAAGTPTDPTVPVPSEEFFAGLDLAVTKRLFGTAKGEDGVTYKFDKNGPVSKLWFARGEETGNWPSLSEVWIYGDGRRYFRFEDGDTIFDPPGEAAKPQWLKK